MIIINLKGGLGNQLFQYALGQSIQNNGNIVKYNISSFERDFRDFRLDYFKTNLTLLDFNDEVVLKKNYIKYNKPFMNKQGLQYKFIRKVLKIINDVFYVRKTTIHERLFFDRRILRFRGIKILDGYWANILYFDHIKSTLQERIELKACYYSEDYLKYFNQIRNLNNTVSIHVRRGDYQTEVNKNIFIQLDLAYYSKAIEYIKNRIDNAIFIIFSDDIDWCKNTFIKYENIIFVDNDNLEDYHDFSLMKECKHNIIANSTFSWWASYLNLNVNKIMIAPKRWYQPGKRQNMYEKFSKNFLDYIKL